MTASFSSNRLLVYSAVGLFFQLALYVLWMPPAKATEFECRSVSPHQGGHRNVHQQLETLVDEKPYKFSYCDYDWSPRWHALWQPFEERSLDGVNWRRYASALCFDINGDSSCRVTEHVFADDSHVVVDIENCDVSLEVVSELSAAMARTYPGHEILQVEYTTVEDGGAWSPESYGFEIRMNEPPHYRGGTSYEIVRSCSVDTCDWHVVRETGRWSGGNLSLQRARREQGDPLIEYITN